jgi:hypothetical protein
MLQPPPPSCPSTEAAAGQGTVIGGSCAGSAPDSELRTAWVGGGAQGEAARRSKGGDAAAPRPRRPAAAALHGWSRVRRSAPPPLAVVKSPSPPESLSPPSRRHSSASLLYPVLACLRLRLPGAEKGADHGSPSELQGGSRPWIHPAPLDPPL